MTGDNVIFFELAAGVATGCIGLGCFLRQKETSPAKWPQVLGSIISSKSQRRYMGQGREEAQPIIEYQFNFKETSVKSTHWRFGNISIGNSESANAVVARYPAGATVTVFVNLKNPEKSVLEHGASSVSWFLILFGAPFAVMALFLLIYAP